MASHLDNTFILSSAFTSFLFFVLYVGPSPTPKERVNNADIQLIVSESVGLRGS